MKLLTIQDIAARWQLSVRAVRRIVARHRRGKLRPARFTKRTVRWTEERILDFERSRSV